MTYAPTAIDPSRLPAPDAIETFTFDGFLADIKARFLAQWAIEQQRDPTLPDFTEGEIETHPFIVVLRTWIFARGLDRQRVNDVYRSLIAPLAAGASLDQIAGGRNILRLVIAPATASAPAIMEGDAGLLRRYLESFDAPAAGSVGRYLFDAWSAWPQSQDRTLGLWDARVNGRAVHDRRGDADVVLIGPFGRLPTTQELARVRAAVTDINRAPEAVAINVMAAGRVEYAVSLVIEVPGNGPAPETVRAEAEARVRAVANGRILIGGEIPEGLMVGAAYGSSVIKVRDLAPVVIAADPYKVPVMTTVTIAVEVRP